ncbi:MAG: hypothetical protein Q4F29_10820, partial [Lachnospiraceae bacterium]|nr:hypothetical protein [Lachnospiraceae bacterium]
VRKHITGTVTAYDWEYLPGGHVSGGTLSLLYHTQAGPLLCASVGEYSLKEPNNMQIPQGVRHECLAPRIEAEKDGVVYSSIYEDRAVVVTQENEIAVTGVLKDIRHQALEEAENGRKQPSAYRFRYHFLEDGVEIEAEFQQGRFICPLVSRGDERIEMAEDRRSIQIEKETAVVEMRADNGLEMPYGTERIFHLVPGFQAVRVETEGKRCRITILVKEIHRR